MPCVKWVALSGHMAKRSTSTREETVAGKSHDAVRTVVVSFEKSIAYLLVHKYGRGR